MKTIVVGLGNPILGDDGVGWRVALEVQARLSADSPADVDCVSLGGIGLMEHLIGYERAILIDAFALEQPAGSIMVLKSSELPGCTAFHTSSAHDTSLQNAIEMGRSLGARLPDEILIVGIAARRNYEFSEQLSPPVGRAVAGAAQIVLEMLAGKAGWNGAGSHSH